MNWWLVIVAIVAVFLTVGVSAYIIFALTTPSELKTAILPKIVALIALTLAFCAVLMLPYEVANKARPTEFRRYGGGIDTALVWQIILWAAAAFIVVIIPFAMFFYEAHDPEQFSLLQQCTPAAIYTAGLLIVYMILFFSMWYTIGYAVIPFYAYKTRPQFLADPFDLALNYTYTKNVQRMEIGVSAFVYAVGILCGVGWVLFALYGGVGLVGIPVGLSRSLYTMPKRPLTQAEFAAEQEKCANEAMDLIREAQVLQKSSTKDFKVQRKVNAWSGKVRQLENRLERARKAFDQKNWHYVRLLFTFVFLLLSMVLTVMWVLHIFIHNLVKLNGFLNVVLIAFDEAFGLLGLVLYGTLVFYLLWCVICGNVRVGTRFTFFSLHPLKYRDTRINAILFNVGLVLTSTVAIVQFATYSFLDYASYTAAEALFDSYIKRLKYFGPMFPWLPVVLLSVFVLSSTWVIFCPRKKKKEKEEPNSDDE